MFGDGAVGILLSFSPFTALPKASTNPALLTALENALQKQGNKFEFSMEATKERCKNAGVYGTPNFKAHFKHNSKLFKSIYDAENIELSPEGQTELAETTVAVPK